MRGLHRKIVAAGAALLAAAGAAPAAEAERPERVALSIVDEKGAPAPSDWALTLPGESSRGLRAPTASWAGFQALEFDLAWPAGAPTNAQVLVHMKDWDWFWFQYLLPESPVPGQTRRFSVDLSPGVRAWKPVGHHGAWQRRSLMGPREMSVRVFGGGTWNGTARLSNAEAVRRVGDAGPPVIADVRAGSARVRCYEKYEAVFSLPDRYENPFDPAQIAVTVAISRPDGRADHIDAFFCQDYFRRTDATGDRLVPDGPPQWAFRYAPVVTGRHEFVISARDARGEAEWGPGWFEARAPVRPGYVRVSRKDWRFFETDDGRFFFPIGHNARSAFDTRMDEQFPWRQRWAEGTSAYATHFAEMARHGENFAEIWSAAWSLGLEWTETWRGYHGVGQYNTMNAWEMDRVVEEAERQGIYLNVVVHNHGKLSTWCDPEWDSNPHNVENGGYLKRPEDYFTDPRAIEDARRLLRYLVARWGYSTSIFAWELFSELDLCGSQGGQLSIHRQPYVADWHRLMGRWLKDIDPNDHLVSTHVCGDYTHQEPALVLLPEMDLCPIDAYHNEPDPLRIVSLMAETISYNSAFRKPVLITEFGGDPKARQGLRHLEHSLHAALWTSTAINFSGTPLFWWWDVIREQNYFTKYEAIARFMKGEDARRADQTDLIADVSSPGDPGAGLAMQCSVGLEGGRGWIYRETDFETIDPSGPATVTDGVLRIKGLGGGPYEIEFWDTILGRPVARAPVRGRGGEASVPLPPFARDLAFKIRPGSFPPAASAPSVSPSPPPASPSPSTALGSGDPARRGPS
jgi:hypothetical protein